ncbi:peroxisomal Membrane Protein 34 [Tachypleus tridentatus]|uniref:peroxisomal Membrane Protein 34 n=1 Tax=Tachypleus tridentatus TaxID=6853 RepID=UPI003FD1AC49
MAKNASSTSLFSYDTLVHAISGAAGSVTAMTVFFPLDTVRSRLQVEDSRESKNTFAMIEEFIREEGLESLYRGLGPVLTSLCASNFVYFYTFHGLRALYRGNKQKHNPLSDLALASLAGAVNVIATTPLWVVNTRLKMQGVKLRAGDSLRLKKTQCYNGILDGLVKICKEEGLGELWSGTLPSLMLIINPAIQFMVYEGLKREVLHSQNNKNLSSITIFLIGAIAKSISTILTYPLQVVQSKLRYGSSAMRQQSFLQLLISIVRSKGARGLYKGLEAKLFQTVLTAALMFVCYEKIAAFVFYLLKGPVKNHQ